MFGKNDIVVTEDDVGNFVAELNRTTPQPIDEVLQRDHTNLVRSSKKITTGTQD